MKTVTQIGVLALAFSLVLAVTVFAGGMKEAEEGMMKGGMEAATSMKTPSVEDLKGAEVLNSKGDTVIGTVSDLRIGKDGKIAFAVISSGGILGIGTKDYVVPFSAFESSESFNTLILKVDENLLADAPIKSPDVTEEEFYRELYEHYGQAPPYTGAGEMMTPEAMPEKR